MRGLRWIFILLLFFALTLSPSVYAESEYVLPYPSNMPGNSLYKIHLVWEKIMQYWYFGNLGQFKYNLRQSDKYLIEAKTLFEYKQYMLAVKALEKSDSYFAQTDKFLIDAHLEGKGILINTQLLKSAGEKHKEVLRSIISNIPYEFIWNPEKETSTKLNLNKIINQSIKIRE